MNPEDLAKLQARLAAADPSKVDLAAPAPRVQWEALFHPSGVTPSHLGALSDRPEAPPNRPSAAAATQTPTERYIGPYRIERELGRGGMGIVYLASRSDKEYKKQVAIKLIQRANASYEMLQRFRNERQILANLDHPNICRLLDGGTNEDGEPYFVMEYIRGGQPIDEWCNQQNLSVRERVKLFRTVCSAVQYAHQHLIVHRDLKPGNILVSPEGTPKLLDFGIAKPLIPTLTAEPSARTVTGVHAMTPEYASPEQVSSGPIGTASDVYSLGVILYELLTGALPFTNKGKPLHELIRSICEEEPPRPSSQVTRERPLPLADNPGWISRQIAGDLDTIILMALRKDPQRRYTSVEQFSEDLRRYLEGLPVIARKDTFSYRTEKFIKRNTGGIAVGTLLATTLVAGIVSTERQAAIAERRFREVRQLTNSFLFEFHDAIVKLPGSIPARQLVVKKALEYLEVLSKEDSGDLDLQLELARAYQTIGGIQRSRYAANLGDSAGAQSSYSRSLTICEQMQSRFGDRPEIRRVLTGTLFGLGDVHYIQGEFDAALPIYQRSLKLADQVASENPKDLSARRLPVQALKKVGDVLDQQHKSEDALPYYQRAQTLSETLFRDFPANPTARRDLAVSAGNFAQIYERRKEFDKALNYWERTVSITEELLGADPDNATAKRDLFVYHSRAGKARLEMGAADSALVDFRLALEISQELADIDPKNLQARYDLFDAHEHMGHALAERKDLPSAYQHYRKAVDLANEIAKQDPLASQTYHALQNGYDGLADVQAQLGDRTTAFLTYQRFVSIIESHASRNPGNQVATRQLADTYRFAGEFCFNNNNPLEARTYFRHAAEVYGKLHSSSHADKTLQENLASVQSALLKLNTQ